MATVIKLKKSETASSVPTTSNLVQGEVANKGESLGTVLAMSIALG